MPHNRRAGQFLSALYTKAGLDST